MAREEYEWRRNGQWRTASPGGSTGKRTSTAASTRGGDLLFNHKIHQINRIPMEAIVQVINQASKFDRVNMLSGRLYFRCSYNDDNGCRARRQVQQSEADPSVYIITYFDEHTCCMGTSLMGNDEKVEKFVINFGSAGVMDGELNGSPSSTCDDDGLVVCEKPDLCNSPEELQAAMDHEAAELLEQSTPVLEELGMSSPWWQPLGGCLEWEVGQCENLFYIGESIDIDSLLQ